MKPSLEFLCLLKIFPATDMDSLPGHDTSRAEYPRLSQPWIFN